MELLGEATHLRRDFGVAGIEHVAIEFHSLRADVRVSAHEGNGAEGSET